MSPTLNKAPCKHTQWGTGTKLTQNHYKHLKTSGIHPPIGSKALLHVISLLLLSLSSPVPSPTTPSIHKATGLSLPVSHQFLFHIKIIHKKNPPGAKHSIHSFKYTYSQAITTKLVLVKETMHRTLQTQGVTFKNIFKLYVFQLGFESLTKAILNFSMPLKRYRYIPWTTKMTQELVCFKNK